MQRRATEKYHKPDARSSVVRGLGTTRSTVSDYFKFTVFCLLLVVPVYAIVHSAIYGNWIIMVIDALLVPIGFIHGVLLIFGVLV
jgi:hypothetical protein